MTRSFVQLLAERGKNERGNVGESWGKMFTARSRPKALDTHDHWAYIYLTQHGNGAG